MSCVHGPSIAGRSWAEIYRAPSGSATDVVLHVYDLGRSSALSQANRVFENVGMGVYHAGVEVYGQEWSFAGGETGTGVYSCQPKASEVHSHYMSISMGRAALTEPEMLDVVTSLSLRWLSEDYDIFHWNCCHFVDDFLRRLGLDGAPAWLLRSSDAAAMLEAISPTAASALQRCFVGNMEDSPSPKQCHRSVL
mmetsp:Transcript_10080/g.25253  ORF Transcript_10080/g.25253 Transcript_10080/m.25253 type:complete len:194 (-) Transcript_10080:115-696(-)